jgi:hypothetical protein
MRRLWFQSCAAVVAVGLILPSASASGTNLIAICEQWKAPNILDIIQAHPGGDIGIRLQVQQDGERLRVSAQYGTGRRTALGYSMHTVFGDGGGILRRDRGSGTLRGDHLSMHIQWNITNVAIGIYSARVLLNGALDGRTYDKIKGNNSAWKAVQPLRCETGTIELDIDRPGGDYRSFNMTTDSPDYCRHACLAEDKCKAYTYTKPGIQGPQARCWLKATVPAYRGSDCCVSGVVRGSGSYASIHPAADTSKPLPVPSEGVGKLEVARKCPPHQVGTPPFCHCPPKLGGPRCDQPIVN